MEWESTQPLFCSLSKALKQILSCKALLEGRACKPSCGIPTSLSTLWIFFSILPFFFLTTFFFTQTSKTSQQTKYAEGKNKLDLNSAVDWFLKIFVDNMPLNALKLQIR